MAAGIALLSVIMQVCLQWLNNRKNIDANLKAKSRIEWIQNVRELSANYIKIAFEYKIFITPYVEVNEKNILIISEDKISEDEKKKLIKMVGAFIYL